MKEANERKWALVTKFKAMLAACEKAQSTADPIDAEALRLRLFKDEEGARDHIVDRAYEIEEALGYPRAKAFADLALGQLTPLDDHADAFVADRGYRMKSAGDFRRVLDGLGDWLKDAEQPVALEAVSRKVAGRFISESLVVGRDVLKAKAYLSFLRQYWRWLLSKGHLPIGENPWDGQPLPAKPRAPRDAEPDEGKRPFTNAELKALLQGDGGPMLNDLMRIAALSGMRLEEICQLRVADCGDGVFNVREGKTENARRSVPIHSALVAIVNRRTKGRKPTDFLLSELPPLTPKRETRSDPAAKRFTRYRRKRGVDERPNGKAKSNVDFHSFRRWFIRKARDAKLAGTVGFDEWTLAAVVGHTDSDRPKSLDLSQMGYAGKDADKAKRALVEAVQLPAMGTAGADPEANQGSDV